MRTAFLSDIHSNFDALQAVVHELGRQSIDEIICLGDIIGYGAEPQACLDWVEQHATVCIKGNHEAMVNQDSDDLDTTIGVHQAIIWTKSQLNNQKKKWIKSWPLVATLPNIRLAHGSPYQPEAYHYLTGHYAACDAFNSFSEQLCLVGHTHVPAVVVEYQPGKLVWEKADGTIKLAANRRYIVNVGSVGQSRNGQAKAQWVVYDHDQGELFFHALDYPITSAANKIIQAGLPERFATRLEQGR